MHGYLKTTLAIASIAVLCPVSFGPISLGSELLIADQSTVPGNVYELFSDFDPRKDEISSAIVREWEKDEIVFRYVTYHIATFKSRPSRMAAFYAFPKGKKSLPGLLHMHGGGQRAFLDEVEFYAKRGYACLSVNWGGREMENAMEGDANTDWGAVDPTQKNVPGYFNLLPNELGIDPIESPRNNNWYLLTIGCRRGITFLEQQPEVDRSRIGVYGHSMGGNLTVYVAGSDDRVKAAAPSVGGSGFRHVAWPLLPEEKKTNVQGNLKLFNDTLGFESYAPHIHAPLLWLGSTNDFHGIMDDTYRTSELIPHSNVRFSFTPHMNHRFTPEFAVTRVLWFDEHLKSDFKISNTPQTELLIDKKSKSIQFIVTPDSDKPPIQCEIFYSYDPDPRARFWRTAVANHVDQTWTATLPIHDKNLPIFAFANVFYSLEKSQKADPHSMPTSNYALTSKLHTVTPNELDGANVNTSAIRSSVIEDFRHGWRDWYALSPDNPHHWEYSTRKINDPEWRGDDKSNLFLELSVQSPNDLVIVVTQNAYRSYRGVTGTYTAKVPLKGQDEVEIIELKTENFRDKDGKQLNSWANLDLISLRAYQEMGGQLIGRKDWKGQQPKFKKIYWSSQSRPTN